jgi:hypothetical protein
MKITKRTGAIYFQDKKGGLAVSVVTPANMRGKHALETAIVTGAIAARCADRKWLVRQVRWFLGLSLSEATELGVTVRLRKRKAAKR